MGYNDGGTGKKPLYYKSQNWKNEDFISHFDSVNVAFVSNLYSQH